MAGMCAARFLGEGKLALEDVPIPQVQNPDDVLLEVEAVGICGTDLQILRVPPGHPANPGVVLGHEYAGRVVEVGQSVRQFKPGDRVIVDPNLTCGLCVYCRRGMPHMCEEVTTLGIHIDGGLARYNVAPERALYKIPPEVPPEHAVLVEPLSCVVHAVDRLQPQPGESAVVLGAGPIGLEFTQLMSAAGVKPVIVSEPAQLRRERAAQNGAHIVADPTCSDLSEIVQRETGIGADMVVDAVGTLMEQAIPLARRGGRVMIFGQNQAYLASVKPYDITRHELNILGSYTAPFSFPRAIELLNQGLIRPEKLITHRLGLGQIQDGLELLRRGEAIKVVIDPRQPAHTGPTA